MVPITKQNLYESHKNKGCVKSGCSTLETSIKNKIIYRRIANQISRMMHDKTYFDTIKQNICTSVINKILLLRQKKAHLSS